MNAEKNKKRTINKDDDDNDDDGKSNTKSVRYENMKLFATVSAALTIAGFNGWNGMEMS